MENPNIDLHEFRVELEKQASKMERDCEMLRRQFAELNICLDTFPESLRTELEAVADFQLRLVSKRGVPLSRLVGLCLAGSSETTISLSFDTNDSNRIDEMDDISIPLGFSESVLKGVKESILNGKIKREKHRLHQLQNKQDNCLKTLARDEKCYQIEKKNKEDTNLNLKTEIVLLQSQQSKSAESLEDIAVDENTFNSKMKKIKALNFKCGELMQHIEAEKKYLKQFADVPPSISEAAKCVESLKARRAGIDSEIASLLNP